MTCSHTSTAQNGLNTNRCVQLGDRLRMMTFAQCRFTLLGCFATLQAVAADIAIGQVNHVSSVLTLQTDAKATHCDATFAVLTANIRPSCERHCWLISKLTSAATSSSLDHATRDGTEPSVQQTGTPLSPHNLVVYDAAALQLQSQKLLLELHCNRSSNCTAKPSTWKLEDSLQQPMRMRKDHTTADPVHPSSSDCIAQLKTVVTNNPVSQAKDLLHKRSNSRSALTAWLTRLSVIVSVTAAYKLL